jgi:hypothetical protein
MMRKNWFTLAAIWLVACSFTVGNTFAQEEGNGKLVKEERKLSGFKAISVGNAINLVITQGSTEKVMVEADENMLSYIETVVKDGKLKIGVKEGVHHIKRMNVYVTVEQLKALNTSSASKTRSEGTIKADDLSISASSASVVELKVECNNLTVDVSSASSTSLSGSTKSLKADGSSGSSLNSSDLKAEKGNINGSSGAVLSVQVTKEVKAHASSGARIKVSGNPSSRDTDNSSGGSVSFR